MKFINKNLKFILIMILVIILSSGVTAYAVYNYQASQVLYSKNGTETTVKDALDELYNNLTGVCYLGTGTSFDIKSIFPDNYTSLTEDNFIIGVQRKDAGGNAGDGGTGHSGSVAAGGSTAFELSKSYNPSTGTLTISGNIYYNWANLGGTMCVPVGSGTRQQCSVTPFAYLVIGNITDKSQ